jgi:hypothetical protein
MFHRWAFPGLALGLIVCGLVAPCAWGQASGQRAGAGHRRGVLRQNEPNPFSGHTTIPFSVGDDDCTPGTQHHVVTLRIYNILSQVVAFATLPDSAATADSSGTDSAPPRQISNLALACGSYVAHWDGRRSPSHHDAPAGVYMYQLLIDGHPVGMRKMLLNR